MTKICVNFYLIYDQSGGKIILFGATHTYMAQCEGELPSPGLPSYYVFLVRNVKKATTTTNNKWMGVTYLVLEIKRVKNLPNMLKNWGT